MPNVDLSQVEFAPEVVAEIIRRYRRDAAARWRRQQAQKDPAAHPGTVGRPRVRVYVDAGVLQIGMPDTHISG